MSEEAKQDEIEEEVSETADKVAEDAEEVEIVVEGEDATPKPRTSGFQKRLGKMKAKIDNANTEADEERRKREMVEEENKLLRLQAKTDTRPDEDDFDTRKEYLAALDKYDETRIESIAQKQAAQIVQASQAQTTQTQTEGNLNTQIDAHYVRSADLKVPDYEDTEAVAVDILGDDIAKQIVANTDESHILMYHLGKNPAKAESLKSLISENPLKGVLEIGRLAGSLRVKPKLTAPDPETIVDGGKSPDYKERGPKGAKFE